MTLSGPEVCSAAGRLLGTRVRDARPQPCFAGNEVFEIDVAERLLFVKLSSSEAVQSEAAVLAVLRGRGVPVPAVAACDPAGEVFGRPALVLSGLAGQPLDGPGDTFAQAGRHLRCVHAVVVEGFGSVSARADESLGGDRPTWAAAIAQRVTGLDEVVEAGLIEASLAGRVAAAVDRHRERLEGVTSARLLHGDLHPRHVFAGAGEVTGIIDWGDANAGDPIYDLARVFHSAVVGGSVEAGWSLLSNFRTGYGSAGLPDDELRRSVLVYAAVFAAWSMVGEHRGGAPWPPWWPLQAAALRAVLDELG